MHTLTLDANFVSLQRRINGTILPRMARVRTIRSGVAMIRQ